MKRNWLLLFTVLVLLICGVSPGFGQTKNFDSLKVVWEIQYPGDIFAVSPDESLLVTRNNESYGTKTIKVFDLHDGSLLREFPDMVGEDTTRYGLAFLPDNRTIIYACNITYPKGKTRIYRRDIETGIIKDSTFAPDSLYEYATIGNIQVTPDGKFLIISIGESYQTSSYHIFIYDAQTMELIKRIQKVYPTDNLRVSSNSQYIAFSEYNSVNKTYLVYYYDIYKGAFKTIKNQDKYGITDIQFSKDSKKIVFIREYDMIGIYDIEKDSLQKIEMKGMKFGKINFYKNEYLISSCTSNYPTQLSSLYLINLRNNDTLMLIDKRGSIYILSDINEFLYLNSTTTGRLKGLNTIISTVTEKNDLQLIYPNPVTQTLIIPIIEMVKPEQIRINTLNGNSMPIQISDINIGDDSIQINVRSLPVGTYILTIQTNIKVNSYKFVKI